MTRHDHASSEASADCSCVMLRLALIGVALAGAQAVQQRMALYPLARTHRPPLTPRSTPLHALAPDQNVDTATAKQQRLSELERALAEAVSAEEYDSAISLRDQIASFRLDAEIGVLGANAEFYSAFSVRSLSRMESLWADSEDVVCIHPGSSPIYSREQVISSWADIFQSPVPANANFEASLHSSPICQRPFFSPCAASHSPHASHISAKHPPLSPSLHEQVVAANVRCSVHGSVARITCVEELKPGSGKVAATNMFEQQEDDGRWLMVLHQAGPIVPQ